MMAKNDRLYLGEKLCFIIVWVGGNLTMSCAHLLRFGFAKRKPPRFIVVSEIGVK